MLLWKTLFRHSFYGWVVFHGMCSYLVCVGAWRGVGCIHPYHIFIHSFVYEYLSCFYVLDVLDGIKYQGLFGVNQNLIVVWTLSNVLQQITYISGILLYFPFMFGFWHSITFSSFIHVIAFVRISFIFMSCVSLYFVDIFSCWWTLEFF